MKLQYRYLHLYTFFVILLMISFSALFFIASQRASVHQFLIHTVLWYPWIGGIFFGFISCILLFLLVKCFRSNYIELKTSANQKFTIHDKVLQKILEKFWQERFPQVTITNDLDWSYEKLTIISYFPKEINQEKEDLYPLTEEIAEVLKTHLNYTKPVCLKFAFNT